MTAQEIREAMDDAMEVHEHTDDGIREAVEYVANRLGVTVRRVEKAIGW